jgi:hypothetical protein
MHVTLRLESMTSQELGPDIVVDDVDYVTALATARAQIPEGYRVNAILVDGPLPHADAGR